MTRQDAAFAAFEIRVFRNECPFSIDIVNFEVHMIEARPGHEKSRVAKLEAFLLFPQDFDEDLKDYLEQNGSQSDSAPNSCDAALASLPKLQERFDLLAGPEAPGTPEGFVDIATIDIDPDHAAVIDPLDMISTLRQELCEYDCLICLQAGATLPEASRRRLKNLSILEFDHPVPDSLPDFHVAHWPTCSARAQICA